MPTLLPLPASRDQLPRDLDDVPVIDRRFDLVEVYRTTIRAAAERLAEGVAGAQVGEGLVSWDSVMDARAAADLISLFDRALPLEHVVEADDDELDALARLATSIINCRDLGEDVTCVHAMSDDVIPGPLGPLTREDCPNA